MLKHALLAVALLATPVTGAAQAPAASEAEVKVVRYLRDHVKPGERVVVSELYNQVFTGDAERAVLNRLFNTFFKMPLYLAQYQKASGKPPTLAEISEQFEFRVPGEADVMLRILESDPRIPHFIRRNDLSGEITSVNVDRILTDARFGKALERTISGWEGREAPAWTAVASDGRLLGSATLRGQPYLLYFWFSNCPPCVRTSPLLVELDQAYATRGLLIVGLNADRVLELPYSDEDRAAYARKVGIAFAQASLTADVQEAFGAVSVFPTLFVVDGGGTIVEHLVSQPDKAVLDAAIRKALGR
jgi:thiol-disulfide isomerase/thioredoxin